MTVHHMTYPFPLSGCNINKPKTPERMKLYLVSENERELVEARTSVPVVKPKED